MRHLKLHCDAPPSPTSNEVVPAEQQQDVQPPVNVDSSSDPTTTTSSSSSTPTLTLDQADIMEIKLELMHPNETTTDQLTTTTPNDHTTTTTTDEQDQHMYHHQYHHHHHHHHHHHLSPMGPFAQERRIHHEAVAKLTQAQLDTLGTLFKIIRAGDYDEFSQMLGRKCFKSLLNVFIDGQTALHYSLIYGRNLAWCKELIRNGANPNLTNRAGWHPIHLAAFNGSRETMRYLIERIAS